MGTIDLSSWNRFIARYVNPIFTPEGREEYYQFLMEMKPSFYPKYWIAEKFYNTIKNDNRFDDELKRFFSFLYSCGFFMEHIISFEEWLTMKNWETPHIVEKESETVLEILKKGNGISLLKSQLRWLPFLNQR